MKGNHEFFDRVINDGYVSLHRKHHPADEQTFFKKGGLGHQLDYLYADAPVAEYATACRVVPYAEVEEMSDHGTSGSRVRVWSTARGPLISQPGVRCQPI